MSSDASYKSIRDILHQAVPPALPYLYDLGFIILVLVVEIVK